MALSLSVLLGFPSGEALAGRLNGSAGRVQGPSSANGPAPAVSLDPIGTALPGGPELAPMSPAATVSGAQVPAAARAAEVSLPVSAVAPDLRPEHPATPRAVREDERRRESARRAAPEAGEPVRGQMQAFQEALREAERAGSIPNLDPLWDGDLDGSKSDPVPTGGRRIGARDRFLADQQEDEEGEKGINYWTQDDRSVGEIFRNGLIAYVLRAGHESFDAALTALADQLGPPFTVPVLRAISEAGEETRTEGLEPVRLSARAALHLARRMGFDKSETAAFHRAAALHAAREDGARQVDAASVHAEAPAPEVRPDLITGSVAVESKPAVAVPPEESPFLARVREVNDLLEARGLHRAMTLEALAERVSERLGTEVDPWTLAGWRPMPAALRTAAAEAAADVLLRDARDALGLEPAPGDIGRFLSEAEAFLGAARLDLSAGQASPWRKDFGGLLRMLREERGITQRQFGDFVGRLSPLDRALSRRTVSAWERNHVDGSERTLLAVYLKIVADLYNLRPADRQELLWSFQRMRHSTLAAGSVAALGPGRPLREYLAAILAASRLPHHAFERHLGLPAGAVDAYLSGEVLPSREILERFHAHFGLSGPEFELMIAAAAGELSALQARDRRAAALAQALGAATSETPVRDVLQALERGRAFAPSDFEAATIRYLLRDSRRRHDEQTAVAAAGAFAPAGAAYRYLRSVARGERPRRPLGEALEDYINGGGRSFSAFLRMVLDEYGIAPKRLSVESGVDYTALRAWIDGRTETPEEPALMGFARYFGLDDRQERALWHLARGEKTPLAPLVNRARAALLREGAREQSPAASRELLAALIRRSGLSDKEIAAMALVSPYTVSGWRHERPVEVPLEQVDRIAWVLLPHEQDGPAAARNLANLLLGVPEELRTEDMLALARAGDLAFSDAVFHTRMRYRMSYTQYAALRRKGEPAVQPEAVRQWEAGARFADQDNARRWAAFIASDPGYQAELARLARGESLAPRSLDRVVQAFLADGGGDFRALLRRALADFGMTPEGLSRDSGLSERTVANWLSETETPEEEALTTFADRYGAGGRWRRALWHVARGAKDAALEAVMAPELSREALLTALVRRSGLSNLAIEAATGASHQRVSGWRNGKVGRILAGLAEKLARALLPYELEGEAAIRELAGRIASPVVDAAPETEPEEPAPYDPARVSAALDRALAEEIDFWDVIEVLLEGKGMSQAMLAAELGVDVNSATRWKQGGHVKDKSILPRLAALAGLPARADDFARAERDRLPVYDPAVLRRVESGAVERGDGLTLLRKNRKRTAERLAEALGVSEGLVRVWEREGRFGHLTKVRSEDVARAYGVPPDDLSLFLRIYGR